jgi:hypothetical protein
MLTKIELTAKVCARTQSERLSELAERIAENIVSTQKCATDVQCRQVESVIAKPKLLPANGLPTNNENGGGGIRNQKASLQKSHNNRTVMI